MYFILLIFFYRLMLLLFGIYAGNQQEAIAEAVVYNHLQSSSPAILFVSINGEDPSNRFFQRFDNSRVVVRKSSDGTRKTDFSGSAYYQELQNIQKIDLPAASYYVDKTTGQRGSSIGIWGIRWRGPFKAKVEVNHTGQGKSERCTLIKSLRGWVVTDKETAMAL